MSLVIDFIALIAMILHSFLSGIYFGTHFHTVESWSAATATVVSVIDGDTIIVKPEDSTTTVRVRYIGIDTPELHPRPECGAASSTARNRELVAGKTVQLVPDTGYYDTYGRRLAYVYVGNTFVNEVLVAEGWATVMTILPNTEYQQVFERTAAAARTENRGIWKCR